MVSEVLNNGQRIDPPRVPPPNVGSAGRRANINADRRPLVYVVDRSATGDTTHATTSLREAIDWLRKDPREATLISIDYSTGERLQVLHFDECR